MEEETTKLKCWFDEFTSEVEKCTSLAGLENGRVAIKWGLGLAHDELILEVSWSQGLRREHEAAIFPQPMWADGLGALIAKTVERAIKRSRMKDAVA